MLKNPELQMRAHRELDAVVGRDRIPNFEDKENLPFINAISMEAMRWRPVLPLGRILPVRYRCCYLTFLRSGRTRLSFRRRIRRVLYPRR